MDMSELPEPHEYAFTVKELAERWRVTDRAVQKWINKGEFPNAYRVGMGRGSHFRIPVSDVMAFEKVRRVVRQED